MGTAVALVLTIGLPIAVGYALFSDGGIWERWRHKPPVATVEPIECLSADLRRLRTRLEETENSSENAGGKGLKLRAIRAAYVEALSMACQQLEVSPPPRGARNDLVPQWEVYRVEAALRQRGLDVRERAAS